jgi:hypothetical protein
LRNTLISKAVRIYVTMSVRLYVTLHYLTLHSIDPELVEMTVGCGICEGVSNKAVLVRRVDWNLRLIMIWRDVSYRKTERV